MSTRATTLMLFATATLISCTSFAAPDVSGPYAARLTREDIQQIAALPFAGSGIHRGVHSIYAKKPDEVGVQSGQPQWPKDTIVSFTARQKNARWIIVPCYIHNIRRIPVSTDCR